MEEQTSNVQTDNKSNTYLDRIRNLSINAGFFGVFMSALLLYKFKRSIVFGLGLTAGYCHHDLMNVYRNYFSKKHITHSLE